MIIALLASAGIARGLEFEGARDKTIHFDIPEGYCTDSVSDEDRQAHHRAQEQAQPGAHFLQTFESCIDPENDFGSFVWADTGRFVHSFSSSEIIAFLTDEAFARTGESMVDGELRTVSVLWSLEGGLMTEVRYQGGATQSVVVELTVIVGDRIATVGLVRVVPP